MKKNLKRRASLILSVLVFLTTAVTPAMAEGQKSAPTEVTSCNVSGGFWDPSALNLEFKDNDDWLNAVNGVTVDDTVYNKGTISSSSESEKVWEVGNVMGAYGTYKALRIMAPSEYPVTIKVSASGYQDLVLEVTKTTVSYNDVYTATVKNTAGGDVSTTYTATVASDIVNGSVTLDKSANLNAGDTVTVTTTPNEGYELDQITVTGTSGTAVEVKNNDGIYTFTMPAENVNVTASFKEKEVEGNKTIDLSKVKLGQDFFGNNWEMTFDVDGYVNAVSDVKVNGTSWEAKSYGVSSGGAYKKDTENSKLVFAAKDFSSNPTIPVLQSGDVITITAKGYEDLTFKLVVDKDGKASLVEDDGQGDPYELHVKIDGSFEAAIVGQKDYDGVSSASTGGASSNKNSAVKVYGALVQKDTEPAENDWEELDNMSQIKLDGSKCSVSIVPDTEKGTSKDSDSGMEGVYMTISSDLTLSGTPKDAGDYLISVSIADNQGRTAVSNTLPFKIYTGQETLADRLKDAKFKDYKNGKFAWDIMEPWVIEKFGSNVEGEEESVRVPAGLEAWFGSHESGTYGYLGYDIPWEDVQSGNIPQTLYIPSGCDLTLTNMEILSSVHIIVENGGKLTLSDSVVQGIIDVQSGGTFSMNYDAYNSKFTTGASLCGQLRMADGSILENAAIYSHANYLANGNTADRTTSDPVVTTTGNVTVKGKVFIEGDEAGNGTGQTALSVDGTLTLVDGAELVTYGGGGKVQLDAKGGTAIKLADGSRIVGNGKVMAIGGAVLWGDGGTAVSGNGTINTTEAFLQGATANTSKNAEAGKAIDGNVKVVSAKRHVEDGTMISGAENDPLEALYWKSGIDPMPPLDKFVTEDQGTTKVDFAVSIDSASAKYDGTSKTPKLTVKDGETVLTKGVDYKVTYLYGDDTEEHEFDGTEFIKEGTYTLIVTGIGNYEGSSEKAVFTIAAKDDDSNNGNNGDNGNNNGNNGNTGDNGKDNGKDNGNTGDNDKDNGKDNGNTGKDNGNSGNVADKNNTGKNNTANNAKTTAEKTSAKAETPKTGDSSNMILWISLLAISCGAFAGTVAVRRKRR